MSRNMLKMRIAHFTVAEVILQNNKHRIHYLSTRGYSRSHVAYNIL